MILEDAIDVLKTEAQGILGLIDQINDGFVQMVELILACKGRVIVSGIGKSGIIGRKIVATLNSTGTRSLFLHPVEAMHGDLGIVSGDDVFLALSYSGETDELNILLPSIKKLGCPIIAFTGNLSSTLASHSQIIIDVSVEKEACPLGLAPTASSTALLAMGDALAVVLINKHHFSSTDFRRYHPGGFLGQQLVKDVSDIMLTEDAIPMVPLGTPMLKALSEINLKGLGSTLVVDTAKRLLGIITDGDIRRLVAKSCSIGKLRVDEVMTFSPKYALKDSLAYDALNLMETHQITVLPIVDQEKYIHGILHLHDILGKGEFKFNGTYAEYNMNINGVKK
jgi:arabinose-5-phosphate isomerase